MKNKKYMIIMTIIVIVLIIVVTVQSGMIVKLRGEENDDTPQTLIRNDSNSIKYSATEDSIKFKEEYEALNGTIREEDGETYNTVNIPEENPIVYVDNEELLDIINSDEEAYIYISRATCPYCRATVEILFNVLEDLGIEKLYYFDLASGTTYKNEEQRIELKNQFAEKGLMTVKDDGTESWNIPFVAKTKSGEILAKSVGASISYNEGQTKYSELTVAQKQEVYNEYYAMLKD